jgi:hypothetical protein
MSPGYRLPFVFLLNRRDQKSTAVMNSVPFVMRRIARLSNETLRDLS